MADLTIPIIALVGAFGYYLSDNKRKRVETLAGNVAQNELPTGQTIYTSNQVYDAEKHVYDKMKQNYIDSMNPAETNIIPPIYNTYNTRATENLDVLGVNDNKKVAEYNDRQRLENIKRTGPAPEENITTAPMFAPLVEFKGQHRERATAFTALEDTMGGQEVSLLTGQPIDKRHNNMVPFFGGTVKQNVETFTNNTKLDLHTGERDTYIKKHEIASMYDTLPENIYGSAAFTTQVEKDRYIPSYYRNNEKPVEEEYISAPIAGTINNDIRPIFRSVDELRVKNNPRLVYKARHNSGQLASIRGVTGPVEKNRPDTVWDWGQDRWNNSTGEHTGHQMYENFENMKHTSRPDTNIEYYGTVSKLNNVSESYIPLKGERDTMQYGSNSKEGFANVAKTEFHTVQQFAKRHQHLPGDNAYRNIGSAGNNSQQSTHDYGKSGYNSTTVPQTQRDTTFKTHILNVNQQGNISTTHYTDAAKTTIKDSTIHQPYSIQGQVSSDFNSGQTGAIEAGAAEYQVKSNQKESTVKNKYEQGIRHHDYGLGYVTQKYTADVTNKELVTNDPRSDYRGTAVGAEMYDPKSRVDTNTAEIRTRQEELVSNERLRGPQNFNINSGKGVVNITNSDNKLFTELENTNKLRIQSRVTAPIKEFLGEFDPLTAAKKTTVENQYHRLDSNIYKQLDDNPFVNQNLKAFTAPHTNVEDTKVDLRNQRFKNIKTTLPDGM